MWNDVKIQTLHLFPALDQRLISLLKSFKQEDWNRPTIAKLWSVKDVAAHLLDGNLRGLSISRDGYIGEIATEVDSYQGLVNFLNGLNMSWTNAAKRLSPQVLTDLLETTGTEYFHHLKTLNPLEKAVFPVSWAGHDTSPNWLHVAREYTEKFLHQQQIRDAVGSTEIMTREFFYPFIDTLMYAFPYAFRNIPAENGTVVVLKVSTEIGGIWSITKSDTGWQLNKNKEMMAHCQVVIDPETAWKLFSGSWKPENARNKVQITGNNNLADQVLKIVSFMV